MYNYVAQCSCLPIGNGDHNCPRSYRTIGSQTQGIIRLAGMTHRERKTYHFTMTRPRGPICPTSRTVLYTHTSSPTSIPEYNTKQRLYTHIPARTLRSRGSGALRLSSEPKGGYGGSGSRFRGRIPGSRKAWTGQHKQSRTASDSHRNLTTIGRTATYRREHAGYCEKAQIRTHGRNRGTLVVPPPYTGRTEPHSGDAKDNDQGGNEGQR